MSETFPLTLKAVNKAESDQWAIADALEKEIETTENGHPKHGELDRCSKWLASKGRQYSKVTLGTYFATAKQFPTALRDLGSASFSAHVQAGSPEVLQAAIEEKGGPVTQKDVESYKKRIASERLRKQREAREKAERERLEREAAEARAAAEQKRAEGDEEGASESEAEAEKKQKEAEKPSELILEPKLHMVLGDIRSQLVFAWKYDQQTGMEDPVSKRPIRINKTEEYERSVLNSIDKHIKVLQKIKKLMLGEQDQMDEELSELLAEEEA